MENTFLPHACLMTNHYNKGKICLQFTLCNYITTINLNDVM